VIELAGARRQKNRGKTAGRRTQAKPLDSERLYVALIDFNKTIIGAKEPSELFDGVCKIAVSSGLFKFAWVGIADGPTGEMRLVASAGMPEAFDLSSMITSMTAVGHETISITTGEPFVSNDAAVDPRLKPMAKFLEEVGAGSIASFPIRKEGKPFAALILGSSKKNAFDEKVISLLEDVAANISHSIDKHESERKRMAVEFDLRELNAELEKRIAQAESATMRAQTYLDFMSHDLTNILTPVMTYAEMIASDERVPENDRKYSRVVVDHVMRAAKFISRVKNLAIAETMPLEKMEATDLRESFLIAQSEVLRRYPNKDVEIEYMYPNDEPIYVLGGYLIESVIEEILDNSIRYSSGPRVEVTVLVSQDRTANGQPMWRIEISDNGPGMSPRLRDTLLAEASGDDKRLSKTIASGIPFMTRIVRHLGGKISIEDRVQGDYSKGTKIVVSVPGYGQ